MNFDDKAIWEKCGPAEEEHVREFEEFLRVQLPSSYREFLLNLNGFAVDKDCVLDLSGQYQHKEFLIHTFWGVCDRTHFLSIHKKMKSYQSRVPNWLLPIAAWSTDPVYLLDLRPEKSGAIYAQIIDDYPYNANPPFTPEEMWPDKAPEDVSEAHLEELETYWYSCEDIDELLRLAGIEVP